MGLQITKNKDELYTIKSSISDEIIAENVDENGAKKALIENIIWKFMEDVIEIDMVFPKGYSINGIREPRTNIFFEWYDEILGKYNCSEIMVEKFKEISKKYELNVDIK